MKSFDEWYNSHETEDFPSLCQAFKAGQQSKQAEVDELRKRIDEIEGKNKILGMRLDAVQGVMQKEIDLIIQLKGDQS